MNNRQLLPHRAAMNHNQQLSQALRDRDAYFTEAARTKETLADVIPALERASGLKAAELRPLDNGSLTPDEFAALWMARAILERPSPRRRHNAPARKGRS